MKTLREVDNRVMSDIEDFDKARIHALTNALKVADEKIRRLTADNETLRMHAETLLARMERLQEGA